MTTAQYHDFDFHDEDGEKVEFKCRNCGKKLVEYKVADEEEEDEE